ncbi:ComF family protein [Sphingobacterium allocomposti]|uniref:ComF family protein n=2 Tax=Sphingobacterium allocomposti TaxID=415956 RepID=A0A5S5D9R1_9SPHI|nr:ComF family protein [Sphingobacterium composti Yoo et al. 2007 non Ten et al. 2007]
MNMMQIKRYWSSFVSLLFPPLCISCEHVLLNQEKFLCTSCQFHLPITDHHLYPDNEAFRRLVGKVDIEAAAAYLSFRKSSLVQAMVHKLKYRGIHEIGTYFGRCFGSQLAQSFTFSELDLVVPVPIYHKKRKERGYNQSDYIAEGIAQALSLPLDTKNLIRNVHTESQTGKERLERYENVEAIFTCRAPEAFSGKHILLVDDVLTTGATVASAARTLIEQCGCRVSVAVLALV